MMRPTTRRYLFDDGRWAGKSFGNTGGSYGFICRRAWLVGRLIVGIVVYDIPHADRRIEAAGNQLVFAGDQRCDRSRVALQNRERQ